MSRQRRAQVQREGGHRSAYERCPRCKKLRARWWTANWEKSRRVDWGQVLGKRVCGWCVWRNRGRVRINLLSEL